MDQERIVYGYDLGTTRCAAKTGLPSFDLAGPEALYLLHGEYGYSFCGVPGGIRTHDPLLRRHDTALKVHTL